MKGRGCVMAIHRTPKDKDYTVMSNHHLRDRQLSLKAKGLMSQILSLPPDWDYSLGGLAAINPEGKNAIRSALVELERQGYLNRKQRTDATGRFAGNEYTVWEIPNHVPVAAIQPSSDNPSVGNQTEYNIDYIKQIWGCDNWI